MLILNLLGEFVETDSLFSGWLTVGFGGSWVLRMLNYDLLILDW